uniref:F-box domain-containing protein n=1 Tax=Kalanchoe fedtschenkoi TaxID=63787 RepID=A0A7N0TDZ8_KALFE
MKPMIDILPDECLMEILRRLPGDDARSAAACVSKKWLTLLCCMKKSDRILPEGVPSDVDAAYERETRCLEGASDLKLAAVAVACCSHRTVDVLSIRGGPATNFGLQAVGNCCSDLRSLFLWNLAHIGDSGLVAIAEGCKLLENLDLSRCPNISDTGLIAIAHNCPGLDSLSLKSCPGIKNEGLKEIGRCCAMLNSVSICDCPLVRSVGAAALLSSRTSVLSKLHLQGLKITNLKLIGSHGKCITVLHLEDLQLVSERAFKMLGHGRALKKLKFLKIVSCPGLKDTALGSLGKHFSSLKQMHLGRSNSISDRGVSDFVTNIRSLDSLRVEDCRRISGFGLLDILSNCGSQLSHLEFVRCVYMAGCLLADIQTLIPCVSLRALSIHDCPMFSTQSLLLLAKMCPYITTLNFTGAAGLQDRSILPLVTTCKYIDRLNLSGFENLTDLAVYEVVMLRGTSLQVLNLEGCRGVTDKCMGEIARHCLALKELNLSGCRISDSGVVQLAFGRFTLQTLSLKNCLLLTDSSVQYLVMLGRSLSTLDVRNCDSFSPSRLDLLSKSLGRCEVLY